MGLLQPLTDKPGYLKAGFLGFAKGGKTWTAIELAIGTRDLFGHEGPIAMVDTEDGSGYIKDKVKEATGLDLLVMKGRSFDHLMTVAHECIKEGVSVLVVDSITHIWREIMSAYCKKLRLNSSLMAIHHIMKIKEIWAPWPDLFLTAPLHIIVCGRAGHEWAHEENPETGKKELIKHGTKMKVETEFGFEASLLVEMERINPNATGLSRQATVLGDRFGVIDGRVCENPTFEFFRPHVELLMPKKKVNTVDTGVHSDPPVDNNGDSKWRQERKTRVIHCEQIQGVLLKKFPSLKAEDKAAKANIIDAALGTRSWTEVEGMRSDTLKEGLEAIRMLLGDEDALSTFLAYDDIQPYQLVKWAYEMRHRHTQLTSDLEISADNNMTRKEKIVMSVSSMMGTVKYFREEDKNKYVEDAITGWLTDRSADWRSVKSKEMWAEMLSERPLFVELATRAMAEAEANCPL